MTKHKFYAVKRGRKTGIFNSWEECKTQTNHYPNRLFRSFNTLDEAKAYLNGKNTKYASQKHHKKYKSLDQQTKETIAKINSGKYFAIAYVDGKCEHFSTSEKSAWAYRIEISNSNHSDYEGNAQYGASRNRMTLIAMANVLEELINLGFQDKPLLFVSHLTYLTDPFTKKWLQKWKQKGWKRAEGTLQNKDLWQQIDKQLQQFSDYEVAWAWERSGISGMNFVGEYLDQCINDMLM